MRWLRWKRARRVRLHLIDPNPHTQLPSIEGLLVAKRRWAGEYVIALPTLIVSPTANPTELDSRYLVIPRDSVAFYEVIR